MTVPRDGAERRRIGLHAALRAASGGLTLRFWGALLAFAIPVSYMLLWWNRFLGLSDGVFFFYAQQILAGAVPYRDFYLGIPPLQPLKMALLIKALGPVLVYPRAVAILERGIFSLVVYVWLARMCPRSYALLAAVAGAVLFCGDPADLLFSYHHDSAILAVLSGLVAGAAFTRRGRWAVVLPILSGLCAGLSIMTKQTVGVAASVIPPLIVSLAAWALPGGLRSRRFVAAFALGWLLPVGSLVGWLASQGALHPFIEQVFVRGPSSKGSLASVLARPLSTPLVHGLYRQEFLLALLIVVLLWLLYDKPLSSLAPDRKDTLRTLLVGGACCAAILAGIPAAQNLGPRALTFFSETTTAYAGLLGSFAAAAWGFKMCLRRRLSNVAFEFWMLAAISCGVAYMLSLSWAVYSPMAFPCFSAVVAFSLVRLRNTAPARLARSLFAVGVVFVVFAACWSKLAMPYNWVGPREPPVWQTNTTSTSPVLRGLVLSGETAANVDRLTQVIRRHSGAAETVFTYPYFPLLYTLSDRRPPTFAYVHYFDVTPDYIAEADAKRLLEERPAVLVYMQPQAEDLEVGETVFREGKLSGQRRVVETLEKLRQGYRPVLDWRLPGRNTTLRVYARNDHVSM